MFDKLLELVSDRNQTANQDEVTTASLKPTELFPDEEISDQIKNTAVARCAVKPSLKKDNDV